MHHELKWKINPRKVETKQDLGLTLIPALLECLWRGGGVWDIPNSQSLWLAPLPDPKSKCIQHWRAGRWEHNGLEALIGAVLAWMEYLHAGINRTAGKPGAASAGTGMSGTKPQEEEEEEEEEFLSKGFSRLASARSVTTERGLKKHSEPWEWEATKESAGLGREFPKSPRLEVEAGRARGHHLRSPSPSPWMVFLMRSSIVVSH